MPSTKQRQKFRSTGGARFGSGSGYTDWSVSGFQTMTGTGQPFKDITWGVPELQAGASPALSGSSVVFALSGSIATLKFTNTTGTSCPIYLSAPVPKDAATSGSSTLWFDWADGATASAIAVFGASATFIPTGSAISTCYLGISACQAVASAGQAACTLTSTSLANLNAFPSPAGIIVLRVFNNMGSVSQTASAISLVAVRLNYQVASIGASATG